MVYVMVRIVIIINGTCSHTEFLIITRVYPTVYTTILIWKMETIQNLPGGGAAIP